MNQNSFLYLDKMRDISKRLTDVRLLFSYYPGLVRNPRLVVKLLSRIEIMHQVMLEIETLVAMNLPENKEDDYPF